MSKMTVAAKWLMVVVAIGWMAQAGVAWGVELTWWSHWAAQANSRAVMSEVAKRFEAKHPGTTVKITFYEKSNMWPVCRATFAAGSGFPDLVYLDQDGAEMIAAGWLADLSTGIDWEKVKPASKAHWTTAGPRGKIGTWAVPISSQADELFYNKKLFQELGITIPANYAFTQDTFKEVVAKCTKSGRAAFSAGLADREWAALFMPAYLLNSKLGGEDVAKLAGGQISWKDPRVVEVFRYYKELIDLGAYDKNISATSLADSHSFFFTGQACMFPYNTGYGARAFLPPDKGGQPADFVMGVLNYPLMKDGKGWGEKVAGPGGSLSVAAKSPNLKLAIELANSLTDSEIGKMWMEKTGTLTGVVTDAAKVESPFRWFFEEFDKVNQNTKWVRGGGTNMKLMMKPEVWAAWVATVGQGLPNKLIGVDAALDKMEATRLKSK